MQLCLESKSRNNFRRYPCVGIGWRSGTEGTGWKERVKWREGDWEACRGNECLPVDRCMITIDATKHEQRKNNIQDGIETT